MELEIDDQKLTLRILRDAWRSPISLTIGDKARSRIEASQQKISDVLASGEPRDIPAFDRHW
jgi:histidine ammonia-lyase